jgi:putative transposase
MEQRATVQFLVDGGVSVQRACALMQMHRATFRYVAHPPDDTLLLEQIEQFAGQHPRYGERRIHALLTQTQRVNQKRVRRLWRQQRLHVRRMARKRVRRAPATRLQAAYPGHIGPMILWRTPSKTGRRCRS